MNNKTPACVARLPLLRAMIAPACAIVFLFSATSAWTAELHVLHSVVHAALANLTPLGRLPATNRLNLVIGLPVRNQAGLDLLLQQIYDPASPNFRHYLTPAQFTEKFGPTEADYQAVLNFARTNGLQVSGTYPSRKMVDVSATVSDVEKAFHVTLRTYQHPTEPRQFYAPDVEATVDASLPILDVSGLDNFVLPHSMLHKRPITGKPSKASGTAPDGVSYIGSDFRNAYAPGVTLNGTGQNIGLVEMEGYYPGDITNYEGQAKLPNTPLTNIYSDGLSGIPNPYNDGLAECSLDIEMVISMAPGLAKVYVFEGTTADHILGNMAANSQINQFSSSWGMSKDATAEDYLRQMQAQGQTFFQASGDGDAYVFSITFWPADDTNVTSVGGTELVMNGSGASYASESVWNWGFDNNGPWCCNEQNDFDPYWGSGGGVSPNYLIPPWQKSVNMTNAGGSSIRRNLPDVALTASDIWVDYNDGGGGSFGGTSCAAPLWAGFTALVNQQAAGESLSSVGFIVPALYAIGQSPSYYIAFHDTTNGNNTWPNTTNGSQVFSGSPTKYYSTNGYDLCTGWGTPNGQGMIDALAGYAGPIWVNFSASCPGTGSYTNAFCTLALGTNAVAPGGTVCLIGPNSTSVTTKFTKPMTLRAFYGSVIIGN